MFLEISPGFAPIPLKFHAVILKNVSETVYAGAGNTAFHPCSCFIIAAGFQ